MTFMCQQKVGQKVRMYDIYSYDWVPVTFSYRYPTTSDLLKLLYNLMTLGHTLLIFTVVQWKPKTMQKCGGLLGTLYYTQCSLYWVYSRSSTHTSEMPVIKVFTWSMYLADHFNPKMLQHLCKNFRLCAFFDRTSWCVQAFLFLRAVRNVAYTVTFIGFYAWWWLTTFLSACLLESKYIYCMLCQSQILVCIWFSMEFSVSISLFHEISVWVSDLFPKNYFNLAVGIGEQAYFILEMWIFVLCIFVRSYAYLCPYVHRDVCTYMHR